MQNTLLNQKTQWLPLLGMLLLAALITFSWLWAPGRTLWDETDRAFFHALNQPIAEHHALALGWAVMNMRPVDALVGLFLFSFILRGGWTVPTRQVRSLLLAFILLLVWMLLFRTGLSKILHAIDWSRASPTLLLDDSVRLTQLFPGWDERYHLKDDSPISFPGDHASVLFIWAMLVSRFVSTGKAAWVWLLAIVFSLPRLAAGAHWLSDDLVGGMIIALLGYATAIYTPWLQALASRIEPMLNPLLRPFARLPVLGRMSVFSGL